MNPIELSEYYADLLIQQYQGKPKAYDHVKAMVTPVLMPQIPVAGSVWTGRTQTGVTDTLPGWWGLAYGAGVWVAVRDATEHCITSADGISWTPRTVSGYYWYDVAFGGGLFVAVGGSGTYRAMTSTNGTSWTNQVTTDPVKVWYAVTYGNGQFVAVGADGAIMTSSDGVAWTLRTSAEPTELYSVAYGNGVYVAVAPNAAVNRIIYSRDGIVWEAATGFETYPYTDVAYGNGWFVAISGTGSTKRFSRSKDGVTWENVTSPAGTGGVWNTIAFGAGVFVVGGSLPAGAMGFATSTDGLVWNEYDGPVPSSVPTSISYGNGQFVSCGYAGGPPHFSTSPAPDWTAIEILPLAVQDAFDLTNAVGVQLDTLGKYIGASRTGFTFSEAIVLDDDDYRDLLNIIVLRNALKGDLESIQGFIHDNFEEELTVFDLLHMHMNYFYKKAWGLDNVAEYFIKLGLLPRPVGVSSVLITTVPSGSFFGFCSYESPANSAVEPFNLYSDYKTDRPWLIYNYEIEV